jgi:hypothetical protein
VQIHTDAHEILERPPMQSDVSVDGLLSCSVHPLPTTTVQSIPTPGFAKAASRNRVPCGMRADITRTARHVRLSTVVSSKSTRPLTEYQCLTCMYFVQACVRPSEKHGVLSTTGKVRLLQRASKDSNTPARITDTSSPANREIMQTHLPITMSK